MNILIIVVYIIMHVSALESAMSKSKYKHWAKLVTKIIGNSLDPNARVVLAPMQSPSLRVASSIMS